MATCLACVSAASRSRTFKAYHGGIQFLYRRTLDRDWALLQKKEFDRPSNYVFPSGSGTIRRARDYLEAHCQEEISVVDVARAAGVSPRTLQETFRKEMAMTPMGALLEIRMRRAHRDLERLSPQETSVTAIAFKWGFTNLGRFAREFKIWFDQHPSQLLRS